MNWITRNNFTVRRKFNMSNSANDLKGNRKEREHKSNNNNCKGCTATTNARPFKSTFYPIIGNALYICIYVYLI